MWLMTGDDRSVTCDHEANLEQETLNYEQWRNDLADVAFKMK